MRRKELAEGKTSKVALDDCNLLSSTSRGGVPAVPSDRSNSLCRGVEQQAGFPQATDVLKGTINSFVVAVSTTTDRACGVGFLCECACLVGSGA